jgi:hypothetical protein
MIKGLRKHGQRVMHNIPSELESLDKVIARFQEHLDAMDEVARREIAWRIALDREAKLETAIRKLVERVKLVIQGLFGVSSAILRDFGVKPAIRRKPSTATMKIAVEKRRATRKLLGTMGRQQKRRTKRERSG